MSIETVFYNELQPDQFVERVNACPIAYLPLGTLEWHSFHLPYGTDSLVPKAVFERIAKKIGGVVLPELFLAPDCSTQKDGKTFAGMEMCSFKEEHPQQLLGNAYYVTDTEFDMIIKRILANLKRTGFKVVVGHGHGPSMNYFRKNQEVFFEQFGLKTFTLFDLGYNNEVENEFEFAIQNDHAAANETSLIMAIKPELVDIQKLANEKAPVAVWGENPVTKASKEKGELIINKNVEKASNSLQNLLKDLAKPKLELKFVDCKNLCN